MPIHQRLAAYLQKKNISANDIAVGSGLKLRTVQNYLNGQTAHPPSNFFQWLAKNDPELDLRWLLVGGAVSPPVSSYPSGNFQEPASDYGKKGEGGEVARLLALVERLSSTVEQLSKSNAELAMRVNELPGLREQVARLEAEIQKIKK